MIRNSNILSAVLIVIYHIIVIDKGKRSTFSQKLNRSPSTKPEQTN
jgi:hypothetical protein